MNSLKCLVNQFTTLVWTGKNCERSACQILHWSPSKLPEPARRALAGKLMGWGVCSSCTFLCLDWLGGRGIVLRDSPCTWQHGSGLHSAQQMGGGSCVCVIPRTATLELGLGAAVLWLGTRQFGCSSMAGAHRSVPSLFHPNSRDRRGHDSSTWACPQNGTLLPTTLLTHPHMSHIRSGA